MDQLIPIFKNKNQIGSEKWNIFEPLNQKVSLFLYIFNQWAYYFRYASPVQEATA